MKGQEAEDRFILHEGEVIDKARAERKAARMREAMDSAVYRRVWRFRLWRTWEFTLWKMGRG